MHSMPILWIFITGHLAWSSWGKGVLIKPTFYWIINYWIIKLKKICKTLNKGWFLFHVERVISAVFTSGGFYKFTCHWVPWLSFANNFYLFWPGYFTQFSHCWHVHYPQGSRDGVSWEEGSWNGVCRKEVRKIKWEQNKIILVEIKRER